MACCTSHGREIVNTQQSCGNIEQVYEQMVWTLCWLHQFVRLAGCDLSSDWQVQATDAKEPGRAYPEEELNHANSGASRA